MPTTNRPRIVVLFLLASTLTGCGGGQEVSPQALTAARQRWEQAGIHDYDLEWASTGASSAHYVVTVRGGKVRTIESIFKGKATEVHPAEPKFFGVEGLFLTIAEELAQCETSAPFGQPKGTRVVLRFETDPKLGYPKSYHRDVLGTPLALAINVLRFEPQSKVARSE